MQRKFRVQTFELERKQSKFVATEQASVGGATRPHRRLSQAPRLMTEPGHAPGAGWWGPGGRRGRWAASGGDVSSGGAATRAIGRDARAATEYGTGGPLIKVRCGVARRQSPSHSRARGRFHAGAVCDSARAVGRGAGGAGRDGHGRRAPARAAPALAGRYGRARLRLRAEADADARSWPDAGGPQYARQHVGSTRLLPKPARTAANIRCVSRTRDPEP